MMVAYSFKRQFIPAITVGLGRPWLNNFGVAVPNINPKRHTIRAERKRHARPGEEVQLYHGMRTKACFKIGDARCTAAKKIELVFVGPRHGVWIEGERIAAAKKNLDEFARSDGFENWAALEDFWDKSHDVPDKWSGVIIRWEPLK